MDNLTFGMEVLNITQLPGGSYSHANKAVDLGGRDSGKDYWYARGDVYWKCTCCWSTGTNTYHFLSCDKNGNPIKIHCADGIDRIVTVSLTHDNNSRTIGKLYHNEIMFQEGTKYPISGKVTGNHIHLEIAEGDVRKRFKDSKTNTWTLYNELNPLEVMFVDDSFTTIKNTKGAKLKHCSSIYYKKEADNMALKDGYQTMSYAGASLKIFKGYGDYKQLHMLSAVGNTPEKATQDISKFDHSNMLIMAMANCNYFEMSNKSEYGQHYGVEQSEGDNEHSLSLDLAPKNASYQVVYQLKNGAIGKCSANDYWYSKSDVIFACTPYSIDVWDGKAVTITSSAFGNKESLTNSQTMYMYVDDTWCIVCTASKVLPSLMQTFALDCGAKYAFLVDSGGSTQMLASTTGANWEKIIYTGRHIPNVLCLAKMKTVEITPTPDPEPEEGTIPKSQYDELKKEYDSVVSEKAELQAKLDSIKKLLED